MEREKKRKKEASFKKKQSEPRGEKNENSGDVMKIKIKKKRIEKGRDFAGEK